MSFDEIPGNPNFKKFEKMCQFSRNGYHFVQKWTLMKEIQAEPVSRSSQQTPKITGKSTNKSSRKLFQFTISRNSI